jgi:hypothetical protein
MTYFSVAEVVNAIFISTVDEESFAVGYVESRFEINV